MAKIDQKYFGESILYNYILNHVISQEKLQEFRQNYLKGLQTNNLDQSRETVEAFKENLQYFLLEEYQHIDTAPFVAVLDQIETYYATIIPDEFHSFRRYQYSTLFFSYVFFVLSKEQYFKEDYLHYINTEIINPENILNIEELTKYQFNRLGYWMATGSGKTLLMYAIVYMYCKLFAPNSDTLYIVVPSDELRKQHKKFIRQFAQSGLAPIKDGTIVEFSNIPLFGDHEVKGRLTTIAAMKDAKLSPNSILLMDEAHKGASNEAGAIESLKNNYINLEQTMLFEFSATFQEAFKSEESVTRKDNIFDYYHFSSLYKYNLFDFNADGFGKDYIVQAVKRTEEDEVIDKRRLICDSLINFSLQLRGYKELERFAETGSERTLYIKKGTYLEKIHDGLRIYKPLFLGLSWKLDSDPTTKDGKESETTLTAILRNFSYIFTHLDEFKQQINDSQIDISEFYSLLTGEEYTIGASMGFQIWYDKQNDEIKLRLGKHVMVINTGQNAKIAQRLKDDPLLVTAFAYQDMLSGKRAFDQVDSNEDILFLFGSKKFIEGWDSKRPSTILLFKMGGSSTVIATQILGRGLRLYGINGDGFRHLNYSTKNYTNAKLKSLEQISLFGYDIDEFEKFIEALSGDQYQIAIIKKREYSLSFKEYLERHNINYMDDTHVNLFFAQQFPILDETLDEGEEIQEYMETLSIQISGGKLYFIYEDPKTGEEKKMGSLSGQYRIESEVTRKTLEGGYVKQDRVINKDLYHRNYSEVFGTSMIGGLVSKILHAGDVFSLSGQNYDILVDYIKNIDIITDKFSSAIDNSSHMFNLNDQYRIMFFYIEHLERLITAVGRKIQNYKYKSVRTEKKSLKTTHLIDELKLKFIAKKKEDKEIIKLFFGDSAKLNMEKDFESLNDEQRSLIQDLFVQKNKDLHMYERLYYIPTKKDSYYLHDLNDGDVHVRQPEFSPFDVNINKNEEEKIQSLLKRIENTHISDDYDVFYLRNLVGKQGIALRYENIDGQFVNFYSDFLVWFINKSDKTDITVVYLEPKGDGIDKNREKKEEKLKEITSLDVDDKIKALFGITYAGKNKYSGCKVLGVMQMEFGN